MTRVCPAACRFSKSRSTSRVAALSRFPVGSSASTTSGSWPARGRSPPAGARPRTAATAGARPDGRARPVRAARARAAGPRAAAAGEQRGQLHVLDRGQLVDQVEGLEDEPDGAAAQPGQGPLAHLVHPAPGQPNLPGGGPLETTQQVQQGRLPAAAGPHDRHDLPVGDVQVDLVDRRTRPASLPRSCAARRQLSMASIVGHDHPFVSSRAVAGVEPAQVRLQPQHRPPAAARRSDPSGRPALRAGRRAAVAAARGAARPRSPPGRPAGPPRPRPV